MNKVSFVGCQSKCLESLAALNPSQCTSGPNEKNKWVAEEVLSVMYVEFQGNQGLGSAFMAFFL